jgi:hypothetical protein
VGTYRNRKHVVQSFADLAINSREIIHKLNRATLAIVIFRARAGAEVVPGADCLFLFYIRRSWHSGKKRSGENEMVDLV